MRISGTATNGNPFQAKNVTVSGVLLDAAGQIVSLGSTYVLGEDNVRNRVSLRLRASELARKNPVSSASYGWAGLGIHTVNVLPCPTWLSTVIVPCCASTNALAIDSPRPKPGVERDASPR